MDIHTAYKIWGTNMNTLTMQEEIKMQDFLAKHKYKCKICGHKEIILTQEKVLCAHCKNYIYKNEEEYNKHLFKLRLKRELKK